MDSEPLTRRQLDTVLASERAHATRVRRADGLLTLGLALVAVSLSGTWLLERTDVSMDQWWDMSALIGLSGWQLILTPSGSWLALPALLPVALVASGARTRFTDDARMNRSTETLAWLTGLWVGIILVGTFLPDAEMTIGSGTTMAGFGALCLLIGARLIRGIAADEALRAAPARRPIDLVALRSDPPQDSTAS